MVLAYHVILTAYGFWLPNDPRGSWSREVWAPHLRSFGRATKVMTTRSLAAQPHDRAARLEAKQRLKYPAVTFTGNQARAVGRGFAEISSKLGIAVYACSILPDHTHLVIGRHEWAIEDLAGALKRSATRVLNREQLHPHTDYRNSRKRTPSPWTEDGWFVFLNSPAEVRRRIDYVRDNPVKAGLRRQRWRFVAPFDS